MVSPSSPPVAALLRCVHDPRTSSEAEVAAGLAEPATVAAPFQDLGACGHATSKYIIAARQWLRGVLRGEQQVQGCDICTRPVISPTSARGRGSRGGRAARGGSGRIPERWCLAIGFGIAMMCAPIFELDDNYRPNTRCLKLRWRAIGEPYLRRS